MDTLSGLIWTSYRGDALHELPPVAGVSVERCDDAAALAMVMGKSIPDVEARIAAGHLAFVARAEGAIVSHGWAATREAEFRQGTFRFAMPTGNRYLWAFATLPEWRGKGLYPRLLQHILRTEAQVADRFWVLHKASNEASRRGIERAGFELAGSICDLPNGEARLRANAGSQRIVGASELLGIPLFDPDVTH